MSINWNNLRSWNGSQESAFEELCCQLASLESAPPGAQFLEKELRMPALSVSGDFQVKTSGRGKQSFFVRRQPPVNGNRSKHPSRLLSLSIHAYKVHRVFTAGPI